MFDWVEHYLSTVLGPRWRMERVSAPSTYTGADLTQEYEASRDGYFLKRLKCSINGLDTGLALEKEA